MRCLPDPLSGSEDIPAKRVPVVVPIDPTANLRLNRRKHPEESVNGMRKNVRNGFVPANLA
jgi:hypothetical protein